MRRLNFFLFTALVLQLIVFGSALLFFGQESSRVAPQALLAGVDRAAITAVDIESRTGQQVEKLSLEKDGDTWRLPGHDGYPADAGKVARLLGSVTGLESSRILSRGPEHRRALEVDEASFARKVTLHLGDALHTLWLGQGSSGSVTSARSDGREETFGVTGIKIWDVNARLGYWVAQPAFEVNGRRIARLEVEQPGRSISLSRSALSAWQLHGLAVQEEKLDPVLDQLERIELTDVVGRADPTLMKKFDGAARHWTIRLSLSGADLPVEPVEPAASAGGAGADGRGADGSPAAAPAAAIDKTETLTLAELEKNGGKLWLRVAGSPFVVVVPRARVDKILELDPHSLTVPAKIN